MTPGWMPTSRWRVLEPLLDAALDLPVEERPAFLAASSRGNDALRGDLEQMLAECLMPVPSLDGGLQACFAALLDEEEPSLAAFPPALAARFRIEREVQRGQAATVYLARDLRHDRDVAVKVLHPALAAVIGAERFLSEIRVTANLRHPHIVPLFESGEAGGRIYYIMPFVDGETLRDRLERDGAMPVAEAMSLLRDISDAMAYAHARGVVHLDIKPENILLGAGGPVLSDFGIARALAQTTFPPGADSAGHAVLSPSRLVAGTPGYMSPEQFTGSTPTDARSDVYALGVVGYEMLAGERLFPVSTPGTLRDAHLHGAPVPLSRRCPGAPGELSAAIHRALAKSPQERFASAAEFRVALEASFEAARRRISPRSTVLLVAALGLLMVGVAAAVVRWGTTRIDARAGRQLFDSGMRALQASDPVLANELFLTALRRDSTLAIAAFEIAGRAPDSVTWARFMATALRHARTAPDRERLWIQLQWARAANDPTAAVFADSLRILAPDDPEGYLELARSLALTADFAASIPYFRRAIELDSVGLVGSVGNCRGCSAFDQLAWTYFGVDSLEAGERVAREWIARGSRSYRPWFALAWSLAHRNMGRESLEAWRQATARDPSAESTELIDVQLRLYLEDYPAADRLLDSTARLGDDATKLLVMWWAMISLRNQGRLREALALSHRFERAVPGSVHLSTAAIPRATILLETGRPSEARSLFEAMTSHQMRAGASLPSLQARQRTWGLARAATAAAAMRDTTALKLMADSIERIGRLSPLERDRRLHYYVRANVQVARGAHAAAAEDYRRAMESPTLGYTRINLELGRVLLRLRKAPEAVVTVRAALHGLLEGNNYYVTRSDLHELLAKAFDAAGARDSAAAHYESVVAAWERADPEFKARTDSARRWLQRYGTGTSRR